MSQVAAPKAKIRVYKTVVLGDGGVGKSDILEFAVAALSFKNFCFCDPMVAKKALTMQFVYHQFHDGHDPTIEDSYQQQCRIDGEPALLDILDTAGQPEFTAMREQYMRTGEGFIICYSVTDRRSFDEAVAYKHLIDRVRNQEDIPVVLVGNKCDLESERKVSTEEGQALASKWDCPFHETSAALRHFVDDTFHSVVRQIRLREQEAYSAESSKKNKKKLHVKDVGKMLKKIFH